MAPKAARDAREWLAERMEQARAMWDAHFDDPEPTFWCQPTASEEFGLEGDVYNLGVEEASYATSLAHVSAGIRGDEVQYIAEGFWAEDGAYMITLAARRWDDEGNEVDDIQVLEGTAKGLFELADAIDKAA